MIVIIDYNIGNVGSIKNMITKLGFECKISKHKKEIENATKLILSGVGSFDNGIANLKKLNLYNLINKKVTVDKIPILGICLGMQLMAEESQEGKEKGFGWIKSRVLKINDEDCKETTIPILGWNYIKTTIKNPLINEDRQRFYFVHSFYFPHDTTNSIALANVGFDYCVAIQKDNIFGVQFHPEKSHNYGKKVLQKFCEF